MIKVFTTDASSKQAGDVLTDDYKQWKDKTNNIEILSIHSNSNNYGWMLIIHYKNI